MNTKEERYSVKDTKEGHSFWVGGGEGLSRAVNCKSARKVANPPLSQHSFTLPFFRTWILFKPPERQNLLGTLNNVTDTVNLKRMNLNRT